MIIHLFGAGFKNKGAQLMLATMAKWLQEHVPDIVLAISPLEANQDQANLYGLKLLEEEVRHVGASPRLFNLSWKFPRLHSFLRKLRGNKPHAGEVRLKDVDIILDLSGLAYSDKWGGNPMRNLATLTKWCWKKGKKYVLMPQAFGPFEQEVNADGMRKALQYVSLVFARDESSFRAITNISGDQSAKIHKCVDLTHLIEGAPLERNEQPYFVIVPNARMLDKAGAAWSEHYSNLLFEMGEMSLEESNLHLKVMVHSVNSGQDSKIAEKLVGDLAAIFGDRVSLLIDKDPLALKRQLKSARFLIGSRFHALVSALSSGTPVLSTSWQHKYQHLLDEYGLLSFNLTEPNQDYKDNLRLLLSDRENNRLRHLITSRSEELKEEVRRKFQLLLLPIVSGNKN